MSFRDLAEKMIGVERRMAREKSALNLFALFQREDSPGHVDVIVAADWAYQDEFPTRRYLDGLFGEHLDRDDLFALAAVVILDPEREGVRAVARLAAVEHGLVELRDEDIYGATIRRAYFITCKWPPPDTKRPEGRRVPRSSRRSRAARGASS